MMGLAHSERVLAGAGYHETACSVETDLEHACTLLPQRGRVRFKNVFLVSASF